MYTRAMSAGMHMDIHAQESCTDLVTDPLLIIDDTQQALLQSHLRVGGLGGLLGGQP